MGGDGTSKGRTLVSGMKKYVNRVAMTTQAAKKMKTPYSIVQSMATKDWAIRKVNNRFTVTLRPCPADRVSNGWISAQD